MNLRCYLVENGIGTVAFAASIGVSLQALHRYLLGERIPRPDVLERIARVTDGCVQPNDFFAFATATRCDHLPREGPKPEAA